MRMLIVGSLLLVFYSVVDRSDAAAPASYSPGSGPTADSPLNQGWTRSPDYVTGSMSVDPPPGTTLPPEEGSFEGSNAGPPLSWEMLDIADDGDDSDGMKSAATFYYKNIGDKSGINWTYSWQAAILTDGAATQSFSGRTQETNSFQYQAPYFNGSTTRFKVWDIELAVHDNGNGTFNLNALGRKAINGAPGFSQGVYATLLSNVSEVIAKSFYTYEMRYDSSTGLASLYFDPGSGLNATSVVNFSLDTTGVPMGIRTLSDFDAGFGSYSEAGGGHLLVQNTEFNRSAKTIYWTASTNSQWDYSSTSNWTDLSTAEVFVNRDTVNFDDSHSSNHAVTLNTSVTPTSVTVNHSSGADYTISGSGAIGGSGGLTKNGSGKLTLSTNNTYTGGTTVNAGTLVVGHYHGLGNSNLTINGTATTQLAAGITSTNAAGSGAVQLDLLSIAGGATPTAFFDITDNNLIVHNGDYNTLNAQVTNSLYSGFWAGEGIGSSTANTDGNGDKAIGIVNNDDGGGGAFFSSWPSGADSGGAVSTTNTDVLIRYTYFGDANLDGITDADEDFSLWLTGSTSEGALGGWLFGDFNYDGQVDNSDDYALWLTGATSGGSPLGGGVQPVPEPSTLLLAALGLAGVAAFARRRRK